MTRRLGGIRVFVAIGVLGLAGGVRNAEAQSGTCASMPTAAELRTVLQQAVTHGGEAGGLFHGSRMWGSIVNRSGALCVTAASNTDPTQVWPGSQAIAKAKAYTANAFSLDALALSSAMLYTFTQPGHSLWSLGQSNLFDSDLLTSPENSNLGQNQIAGGLIFFGGGVPLYRNGRIIGGLGISGDTSCTDHEIAKRVRDILAMNPPGGMLADDIVYDESVFNHPLCVNTYKNGVFVGNEKPAKY